MEMPRATQPATRDFLLISPHSAQRSVSTTKAHLGGTILSSVFKEQSTKWASITRIYLGRIVYTCIWSHPSSACISRRFTPSSGYRALARYHGYSLPILSVVIHSLRTFSTFFIPFRSTQRLDRDSTFYRFYESLKVLGQLYRAFDGFDFFTELQNQFNLFKKIRDQSRISASLVERVWCIPCARLNSSSTLSTYLSCGRSARAVGAPQFR